MPPPERPGPNFRHGPGRRLPNGRRRKRLRHQRERGRTARTLAAAVVLLAVALVAVGIATTSGVAVSAVNAWRSSCSLDSLQPVRLGQNSFVYAGDGSLLGVIPSVRNRQPVPLDRMSQWLPKATVAVEDRRFYEHGGLDFEGILRAAIANVREGRIVEGGSTITQQVVRNLYIGKEVSFDRKLEEACLALKLDRAWSKDRILTVYLNRVFYGNRAYGVEAAARTYFDRPAAELGPAQAALIAGLPQAPTLYDPFLRPVTATARRNEVLRAMRDVGDISPEKYERLAAKPLGLHHGTLYTTVREPYFFSYVRRLLVERYGEQAVRTGGLRVYTTVHPRFQRLAREAVERVLDEKGDPAAAIVSINPANGAIRAMTAVARGPQLEFNLAAQGRRQAGSSFKPFVLAEAIRQGMDPATTLYLSAPFSYQPPGAEEPWEVHTYAGDYYGASTVEQATLRSDNTVYARLTLDVGPENVARLARLMGIRSYLDPVASIGLGSNSVSPLDMASAYATLAAGGVYRAPMAIRKVVLPSGEVDGDGAWGTGGHRRVLTEAQAWEVTRILAENVQAGTGTAANLGLRPAAGKTGTTDDFTDAWFVGYTPRLSTAVWVGYPKETRSMTDVHGIRVAGGTFPAEIWHDFVGPALAPTPVGSWKLPSEPIVWKPWHGANEYVPPPPPPAAAEPEKPGKGKKGEKSGEGDTGGKPDKPGKPETTATTGE